MTATGRRHLQSLLMATCLAFALPAGTALADIEIIRDQSGMAHVYGDNNAEVFYGFGYIMATDRLFQMEMRKRQTLGRTAEVLGLTDTSRWPEKFLEKDTEARQTLDLAGLAEELDSLSNQDREIIESFTRGVNAFIAETEDDPDGKLAKFFFDHDIYPERWTPLETLAVAVDTMGAYAAFTTQDMNMELYAFLR
ncbi:MAG: penicillin acylase family protein, partial [Sphingomonadales bacterium]